MLDNQTIKHTLIAFLIIIASGFFGQVIKLLLNKVFARIFAATKTTLDDRILDVIRSKVTTLSFIAGFYVGIREVRKGLVVEDLTYHQILDYLSIALFFVLVFVLTRLVSKLITTTLEWYMDEVSQKTQSNITPTIVPMTTKIINIVLFMFAGIIVLDHYGVNIGSFLISLGVGSLAVALAAQETVANMIAGFVILIDQPFRVGDRVKLPSGEEGNVYEIGLRSTRILNFDKNLLIVPNSELVKNRITNFSVPSSNTRVVVEVGVAYGTDVEKTRSLLLRLAEQHPDILKFPAPQVFLINVADSSLQLRLIAHISDVAQKFEIETTLREQIYKTFTAEGIPIPFPHHVVHISNADAAQVAQKK